MKKRNYARELFKFSLGFFMVFILIGVLSIGIYSGANKNALFKIYYAICSDVKTILSELTTVTKLHPSHFLYPSRKSGQGVVLNDTEDDDLILLTGFFDGNNEIRLIRRDGSIVNKWTVRYSDYFPTPTFLPFPPQTDWNVDIHGVEILPDGSIVFNFEYSGLVCLNKSGKLLWRLRRPTHHSVERACGGGFWVPSRKFIAEGEISNLPFPPPYSLDTILKVSAHGEILKEISVPHLLIKNNMEALLTSTGENNCSEMLWDNEVVHLNKIAELDPMTAQAFGDFQAGDLILSIKKYNMILVFDPKTEIIKWWKIGPWLRQHDPEFNPDGTITVFNNNCYHRTEYGTFLSNIIKIDPANNECRVVLGGDNGVRFYTNIRGKHELTRRGGFLVADVEAGRVFETNAAGKLIWEYINRYDADEVAQVTEARIYPADYFEVKEWR